MKKTIVTLLLAIVVSLTVYASRLSSNSMFQGEGVSVMMYTDGAFWFDSRDTGRISGTYDISGTVEPGCSRVSVTFKADGETIYGEFFWPVQGDLMLNFSNIIMTRRY